MEVGVLGNFLIPYFFLFFRVSAAHAILKRVFLSAFWEPVITTSDSNGPLTRFDQCFVIQSNLVADKRISLRWQAHE